MAPILDGFWHGVQQVRVWLKREEPIITNFFAAFIMGTVAFLPELGVFRQLCPPIYLAYVPVKIIAGLMVIGCVDMCRQRFSDKQPPSES